MDNMYTRIEGMCKDKKINITTMCTDAGVNRSSLTDLKMGRKQSLAADTLSKIANYFDVSVDYLLGNAEQKKPLINDDEELTEYLEELRTRPELRMMFKLTKSATKADVEKAVKIIEALMDNEE